MSATRVSYVGGSGAHRFSADVDRSLVRQEIEPLESRNRFTAELAAVSVGPFQFLRAVIPAIRARRTPDLAADDDVFVLRSRRGTGTIGVGGLDVVISPDDLVVTGAHESFDVVYPNGADLGFLTIPASLVDRRFVAMRNGLRRLDATSLGGRFLTSAIDASTDPTVESPQRVTSTLTDVVESAIALAVEDHLTVESDDVRTVLRHRALRLIDKAATPAELRALGPAWIASRLHISVRQLHRCFEGGPSVSDAIRGRRVAEAARLLRSRRDLNVAAVAARLGFASGSHLATHFRAVYGHSPGEWRDRARS